MRQAKTSPLKGKPLRNPGQSLEAELHDQLYDRLLLPLVIAVFLLTFAAMEWVRYYKPTAPAPLLYSAFAAIAVLFAAFRIVRAWPRIRALKLGRDGERVVGQYLERLRVKGYEVFHDVIGSGFNVDHVLIGPAGLFCIETKTFSKPQRRDAKIEFDGDILKVNGLKPDRDPIVQAKAQASWLREIVSESTGKKLPVRSVILFPGWFVEQTSGSNRDVWVLEPKALPAFLDNEEPVLVEADIKLASFHLSRFIRTST